MHNSPMGYFLGVVHLARHQGGYSQTCPVSGAIQPIAGI